MEGQRELKLSMRRKLESFKSSDARMYVVTKNILNYNVLSMRPYGQCAWHFERSLC